MPIQKTKTLPSGVSGNYWRATSVSVDLKHGTASIKVELFKDSTFKDAQPLFFKIVNLTITPSIFGQIQGLVDARLLSFASEVKIPAVAEVIADPTADPPIEGVAAVPAVYKDEDLKDGTLVP